LSYPKESDMSAVTARFYVSEMTRYAGAGNVRVKFSPAYANGKNAEWASATPSGSIELQVTNPAAIEEFSGWLDGRHDIHITLQPVSETE